MKPASPYLYFIKFLLGFFILYLFFPFYRGITAIGGKVYSPFLDHHFNIINGLTRLLTGAAKIFLEVLNYNVYQKNYASLSIGNTGGINVNPSCLGWGVMSFWIAFVFANNGTWKHKLKWMILGIVSICLLNVLRIALIALAVHLQWKTITTLDHHQTFNIFSYGFIFILMFWYTREQRKYEKIKHNREESRNQIDAI